MIRYTNKLSMVLVFILSFVFINDSASSDASKFSRNSILKKYRSLPESRKILYPKLDSNEDYILYVNSISKLSTNQSAIMSEFIADLLELNIGETTSELLYYSITKRNKEEIIKLLKEKLARKPYTNELSPERIQKLIWELIYMRINEITYVGGTDGRPTEIEKKKYKLYYFQKLLENIKETSGKYPETLPDYMSHRIYEQKFEYLKVGDGYFLRFSGEDQKFNTKDDPKLPLDNKLRSFPVGY